MQIPRGLTRIKMSENFRLSEVPVVCYSQARVEQSFSFRKGHKESSTNKLCRQVLF